MSNENTRLGLVAAAVALVLVIPVLGSSFGGPTTVTNVVEGTEPVDVSKTQAVQKRLTKASAIDGARIVGADAEPENWLAHGRTYGEQRYSPLDKIKADNVKNLGLAWTYETGTIRGLEASPIVVDGIMFATGSWSKVYALDAKSGEELWTYDPEVPGETGRKPCCDVVNRGVAVWKGRVYVGTLDGRLVALDAKTGKPVWDVQTVDRNKPYTVTGAPRIVKGKVIIGNGGAELGVRGYITAYDADTGKQLWRFYTVPGDPRVPVENEHLKAAMPTWKADSGSGWKYWEVGGGGTAWDSMAYDPDLDLLYVGTGNGSPWSRFLRSPGGGDNLYLSSILAIKPDDGTLAWHFQTTPGDTWDYTATQHMILADLEIDGAIRKVIMQAPKNGFFYVLDRATGEFISAKNYIPVTWAKGLDAKGRPIEDPATNYRDAPKMVQPSPHGGHNWQPMAYNPQTKLVYIPVQLTPFLFPFDKKREVKPGVWNTGLDLAAIASITMAGLLKGQPLPPVEGYAIAWDPISQKEVWRAKHPTFWNGGMLTTAGNLVFQGSGDGMFTAWKADSGEEVWKIDAKTGIIAPPVTYQVDGEQYVVVLAGWGGALVGGSPEPANAINKYGNNGKIFAFKLGGQKTIEAQEIPHEPMAKPPEEKLNRALVAKGDATYHRYCAVCHGFFAMSAGVVPDLRHSIPDVFARYKEIVLDGERKDTGMASFADQLKEDDVAAIRAYILNLANAEYAAQQKTAATPPTPAPTPP
ncbi:MAG: PQQ-dependent dehydrogenase, methanol/ethanol family [Micropepsaceae bacterium]